MKARISLLPAFPQLAILALVFSLTIACGASMKLATIDLHDAELKAIVQKITHITSTEGWDFEVTDAEIKEGFIQVNGDYSPLGGGLVSGSLDVVLKVDERKLVGEIDRVNIDGFAAPDKALNIVCDQVVQQIIQKVSEGKQQVEFETVEIQEGIVKVVLRYLP